MSNQIQFISADKIIASTTIGLRAYLELASIQGNKTFGSEKLTNVMSKVSTKIQVANVTHISD